MQERINLYLKPMIYSTLSPTSPVGTPPIHTLIDRADAQPQSILPEELKTAYGGDLWFPAHDEQRPYVIANFVSTLDGVVSYEIPAKSGGGDISGFNRIDRFIMGL